MFKNRLFSFPWILALDGGGAGGGGGAGAGAGGAGEGGGTGGAGGAGTGQPFATFPDEQSFMRAIGQKTDAQLKAIAQELGFDSVDAMKEAAKAKKEADQASMTELEREKQARAQAEAEAKAAREAAQKALVDAEIMVQAALKGFKNPAHVVALLDRSGIDVKDGKVTGVKEAIEQFAKENEYMLGQGGGAAGDPGSGGGGQRQGAGGGQGEKGSFGKRLAEQNKTTAQPVQDAQKHYFGS